jgi:hypothetical protein
MEDWEMDLAKKALLCLAFFMALATEPIMGADIAGKVLAVPPAIGSAARGVQALGPGAGATVKALSLKGDVIAEAKTDATGSFSLKIPANRDSDVALVQSETSGAPLRALYNGGKTDIDPITEIIAWKILASGVSPDYYTAAEMKIIYDKLLAMSASMDFSNATDTSGIISSLLDQPDLNIMLGTLTSIYSMQGDNRDQVETLTNTVNSFLQGFTTNNKDLLTKSLAPNASIYIGEEIIKDTGKLIQSIDTIHSNFKDIRLESFLLNTEVTQNKAVVTTTELLQMTSRQDPDLNVDEAWVARNMLELIGGNWGITAREMPKCNIGKAAIVTDGHLNDWTNIQPCYYRQSNADSSGDTINALFFARDDVYLYWRMDLDMKIQIPGAASPIPGIPRGVYSLYLLSGLTDKECGTFINFINNELTSASSGGRACIRGTGDKINEVYFMYNEFAVGRLSIEGSIPIQDFSYFTDSIYAFGNANKKALPGMPANPDFKSGVVELIFK